MYAYIHLRRGNDARYKTVQTTTYQELSAMAETATKKTRKVKVVDPEINAMRVITEALNGLVDQDARLRVRRYIDEKFPYPPNQSA
jgi:hypothetical protein